METKFKEGDIVVPNGKYKTSNGRDLHHINKVKVLNPSTDDGWWHGGKNLIRVKVIEASIWWRNDITIEIFDDCMKKEGVDDEYEIY